MTLIKSFIVAAATLLAAASHAQLTFSGPANLTSVTSSAPLTPPQIVSVTSPPAGILLTGDFFVTPIGSTSGFMLQYTVDRPISGVGGPFNLTTNYTGYISLTGPGVNNPTNGVLSSYIFGGGVVVPGTTSAVNFSQVGNLTNFSTSNVTLVNTYIYTPGDVLRLEYWVDLNYVGPGGTYDLNFPASAFVTPVPEPASAALLLLVAGALSLRRRRRLVTGEQEL